MLSSQCLSVLVNPDVAEAEKIVTEAFSKRRMLIVVGRCWVRYSGRASSKLELGDRVLIIKEDGSLMVHRSVGHRPVNWQPPGCVFHARAADGLLVVRAVRHLPSESVEVVFDAVQLVSSVSLVDSAEFSLYASEFDMHRAVLVEPSLLEEGFRPVSYEKRVEPGFLDVYGEDSSGRLVVVEVKRKPAGKQAVVQLAKYVEAIRDKADRQVRGILAAPDIARDVHRLLDSFGLEFRRLDPKKCAETLQRSETRKLAEFLKETRADDSG